ncbi:putative aspartate aminotransferase [Trypanosoma rangeli]|uniref:Putative aspartate aminotransferase n=1 Tax=Trypanosoma rangeli TaxID=5698 RepID=A0A422NI78_TRYRA|nr:putative aspartate aminotransferase [Trypanosoma rangeli]RNF05182.1 putative aspartate aminotransferase [Trypanosoma rangeli]|eukprot:RNF05182.1 putative aspartate aminotransferase [Trypanosoma rangeli]
MATTSVWNSINSLPPDAIFALAAEAKKAPQPKADLIIGAYRDADGRPYPLKVVRKAERRLLEMNLDKEYLPMAGYGPLIEESMKLIYGDSVPRENLVGAQGLSGTGSLCLGAFFISRVLSTKTPVYISNPTWPNHYAVMSTAGLTDLRQYRYYNDTRRCLDFEGLMEDLGAAPAGSVVILHACAHNPTGMDPTHEQWGEIAKLFKTRRLIPFFDSAYQGYATGSLDNDAYAVRLFARQGMEMLVAQSYSKNMGLYSERVGVCSVVTANPSKATMIRMQLEHIARGLYSSPPSHGARVAHLVLSDPELRSEWEAELCGMAQRVQEMRQDVYNGLKQRGTPGNWEHVVQQVGMFSYLGLTKAQCAKLVQKRVFVLASSRANMASLTKQTTGLLVGAIDDVVRDVTLASSGVSTAAKAKI